MSESLPVNVREFLYELDQNLTTWKSKADACAYHVNLFFVDPPCFGNSFPPGKATSAPNDRDRDSQRYTRRAGGKPVCRRCQE